MSNFVLMHQSIVDCDAIGQDIAQICLLLSERNTPHLHCDYLLGLERFRRLDRDGLALLIRDPETVIIYHHSNYWAEGERILRNAHCRIVFRYHNITPPHFFRDFPDYQRCCIMGREQTYRFAHLFPDSLWMSDSHFNLTEMGLEGCSPSAVVPPFPDGAGSTAEKPSQDTLRFLMEDDRLNVFFIGRFVPNKGHLLLARVLVAYREHFGPKVRLSVFGKLDPHFQSYFDAFMAEILRGGTQEMLNWAGCISNDERMAYYLGADAYICCSEHEGFCVPLVEAQAVGLPVVARATSGVSETIGAGQPLLGDDPVEYAYLLNRIATDKVFRNTLTDRGYRNVSRRFQYRVVRELFLTALQHYLGRDL